MTFLSKRWALIVTVLTVVWLTSVALVLAQAQAGSTPQMSDQVFKNIQVLKGIPVDEFMGTMGPLPPI
jgi:hypothetical protein